MKWTNESAHIVWMKAVVAFQSREDACHLLMTCLEISLKEGQTTAMFVFLSPNLQTHII